MAADEAAGHFLHLRFYYSSSFSACAVRIITIETITVTTPPPDVSSWTSRLLLGLREGLSAGFDTMLDRREDEGGVWGPPGGFGT